MFSQATLMLNLSTRWHTFTYLFNSSEVFHGHSFITIGSHCELCDISAKFSLDLPWKKKKNHRMSREVHMKHNIASCPLFEGIKKHIWMVCFCKMKCLPTNLFTVLHKKSITSLAFGWHKINRLSEEMSLCLYYSQEVPSKTPSRKEHFIP